MNKISLTTLPVAAIFAVLVGCSTPYQDIGSSSTGGFSSERIAENRFSVSFEGNGFTSPKKARNFAMLRAAEVALEHNYSHFTVDGQGDLSSVSMVHTGSTSATVGNFSPNGTYSGFTSTTDTTIPVFKPGSKFTITCYDGVPSDKHIGKVLDARTVVAEIRGKYHLKQTSFAQNPNAW